MYLNAIIENKLILYKNFKLLNQTISKIKKIRWNPIVDQL